ncbi:O-antigen ligase family protein [Microbacterium sp. BK668]|uniref:O-antigen ligase family protein n=1 Tax=Microbacterium sp. BK668 TaxID=2512118 RepID=UPI00105D17F0|nr:O-antigen ligase family protein [Microbacterium sp. BK668]TDN88405.1 O-antigen ligase [Microbacterium sp. BK668]
MSEPGAGRGLGGLLASAALARAFTLTVFGTVFGSVAIERMAGRVTYVTIVTGLCVIAAGMLAARRREISFVRLVPTTLVLFVGWAFASIFWSSDATRSFWGWVSLVGVALLAVTIGHVRDTLQTVRALGDVMRVMLGVSLGLEILSGILLDTPLTFLGIQGDIAAFGPIQGVFGTRNLLGFAAVLALITFLVEYRTQSVRPGVSLFSVVLGGVIAVLSDSPTVVVLAAAVGVAAGVLAVVRHATPHRRTTLQWIFGAIVAIGLVAGYIARHPIIAWLGAGSDFSTRANLWASILIYQRMKPVQGWGWFGPWAQSELPFWAVNFSAGQSHASGLNAYFDVLLQLGWVGLVLFLAFAGFAFLRAWLVASERRSIVYAWTPLILVALLVDSMFESFTLWGFGWLLLVVCAVRAAQSRSWRDRFDDAENGGSALPHVPGG